MSELDYGIQMPEALSWTLNRKEIERYLGYHGHEPEAQVARVVSRAIEDMRQHARPRSLWQLFPLETDGQDRFRIADMTLASRSLGRNLKGCDFVVLFAATIGVEADLFIRRSSIRSSLLGAVYQAVGASLIEGYCNAVNGKIARKAKATGYYCRPRFSPGYGDVPLGMQKDWFRLLPITKKLGIELTDSCLMIPSKSVTALIGLSRKAEPCMLSGCESCTLSGTCAYSRIREKGEDGR